MAIDLTTLILAVVFFLVVVGILFAFFQFRKGMPKPAISGMLPNPPKPPQKNAMFGSYGLPQTTKRWLPVLWEDGNETLMLSKSKIVTYRVVTSKDGMKYRLKIWEGGAYYYTEPTYQLKDIEKLIKWLDS